MWKSLELKRYWMLMRHWILMSLRLWDVQNKLVHKSCLSRIEVLRAFSKHWMLESWQIVIIIQWSFRTELIEAFEWEEWFITNSNSYVIRHILVQRLNFIKSLRRIHYFFLLRLSLRPQSLIWLIHFAFGYIFCLWWCWESIWCCRWI